MSELANAVTDLLALGTIGAQLLILDVLVLIFFRKQLAPVVRALAPYILSFTLIVTLAGSVLTLVYSEVFGMVPCFLCWLQRAFLYPMPFLLGYALWRPFPSVWKWVLGLSIPGAIVAFYQHYLQMGGASLVACPSVPGAEDCAQRLIFEFGYVTFPMMALTTFALVALLMVLHRVSREEAR